MAKLLNLQTPKSYASRENAIKAVEKLYPAADNDGLRYLVVQDEATGRFFPVFIGNSAVEAGVFFNFHVAN